MKDVNYELLPLLADHYCILASIKTRVSLQPLLSHTVLDYKHADWDGIQNLLNNQNWEMMNNFGVDQYAERLEEIIADAVNEFIPKRKIKIWDNSHPWINEHTVKALQRYHESKDEQEKMHGVKNSKKF